MQFFDNMLYEYNSTLKEGRTLKSMIIFCLDLSNLKNSEHPYSV